MTRIISPSVLSADFAHLGRDVEMLNRSAAEWIHIDVMDGVFVPNISYGFPILKAIRDNSTKFLDTHLMIVEPEKYVERFAEAGSDMVTFHVEATDNPRKCVELIKAKGAKAGVSIKPATPVSAVADILDIVDMVLVMSVEPGFGGQSFMPVSLEKLAQLRKISDERGLDLLLEVDGGVSASNAGALFNAGCNVLVAGSSVFKAADPNVEIINMLNAK